MELNNDEPTSFNREARAESIHRMIGCILHSRQCSNTDCQAPQCKKIKRLLSHAWICRRKSKFSCPLCKHLLAISCYHAQRCHETNCLMPYCSSIKKRIKNLPKEEVKREVCWRESVSVVLRDYYACKLAVSLTPSYLQQYDGAVAYDANEIEKEVFEKSCTREEYYKVMAEKIDHNEKALEHQQLTPEQQETRDNEKARLNMVSALTSPISQQRDLAQLLKPYPPLLATYLKQRQISASTSQLPSSIIIANLSPASVTKEWHHSITAARRKQLVHKLVREIFPTREMAVMLHNRMRNLVAYARNIEKDIYEVASTRAEYYNLLAAKIDTFKKELDKQKEKRTASEASRATATATSTSDVDSAVASIK